MPLVVAYDVMLGFKYNTRGLQAFVLDDGVSVGLEIVPLVLAHDASVGFDAKCSGMARGVARWLILEKTAPIVRY